MEQSGGHLYNALLQKIHFCLRSRVMLLLTWHDPLVSARVLHRVCAGFAVHKHILFWIASNSYSTINRMHSQKQKQTMEKINKYNPTDKERHRST